MNIAELVTFDFFPLVILGAVIGLDVVSFPQAMYSRPIVGATVAGAFAGDAMQGMLIGALLELIALETLPFGASRYPEWGTPSVVGGALLGTYPEPQAGALAVATLAALLTAFVSGASMINIRQRNVRNVRLAHYAVEHGSRRAVLGVQLHGLVTDLLRGGLITFFSLLIFSPLMKAIVSTWTFDPALSRTAVVALAATAAVGGMWKIFNAHAHSKWLGWMFAAGLVVGMGALVL